MKVYVLVLASGLAAGILAGAKAVMTPPPVPQEDKVTAKVVKSANAFLATLADEQRKKEVFAFDDEEQRVRWSNLPLNMVPRGGIALRDLNPDQRAAVMSLLKTALSAKGFQKVSEIMEAEGVLAKDSAGGGMTYGADLYFISILGTPSESKPWMLQFGGHHLGVNLTINGAKNVLTPTLTGANPASFVRDGKTIRPLADESDRALALVKALDEGQLKKATLNYRIPDVVLGPGKDGQTIVPEGLKVAEMTADQQKLLLDVIAAWAGIVNDESAADRMKEIKDGLGETWFAWSGATTAGSDGNATGYYRIQGPKLVIEYAPQGGNGMHIHTIYRDPTNDYGRGLTSK
jgi:hypothetical protein